MLRGMGGCPRRLLVHAKVLIEEWTFVMGALLYVALGFDDFALSVSKVEGMVPI